ncbi:MAG: methyltransferase domain-containing protein [bacterium]|nr:methyltransferase domain-containing protein [bacterium]
MLKTTDINDFIKIHNPDYIVLDCDGTLYPEIGNARTLFIKILINYLRDKFKYTEAQAFDFVSNNKTKFCTESEIGACLLAGINEDEFNQEVLKKIPLDSIGIERAFDWQKILKYNIPIIIFTNNSSFFADLIVKKIGIASDVIKIFGEKELDYKRKPDVKTFEKVTAFIGDKTRVLYFDDNNLCLAIGKKMGWNTVKPLFKNSFTSNFFSIDGLLIKTMDYQDQYLKLHTDLHEKDAEVKTKAILDILPKCFKPNSILDIACGSGKILLNISNKLKSKENIGIDISSKIIDIARKNDKNNKINWIVSDIFKFNEDNFDLVLAIDIVEHIPNDLNFLKKIKNFGKYIVIKIPVEDNFVNNFVKKISFGIIDYQKNTEKRYGHLNHYNLNSFIQPIKKSGLLISNIKFLPLPKRSQFFWEILRFIFMPLWFVSEKNYVKFNGGFIILLLK